MERQFSGLLRLLELIKGLCGCHQISVLAVHLPEMNVSPMCPAFWKERIPEKVHTYSRVLPRKELKPFRKEILTYTDSGWCEGAFQDSSSQCVVSAPYGPHLLMRKTEIKHIVTQGIHLMKSWLNTHTGFQDKCVQHCGLKYRYRAHFLTDISKIVTNVNFFIETVKVMKVIRSFAEKHDTLPDYHERILRKMCANTAQIDTQHLSVIFTTLEFQQQNYGVMPDFVLVLQLANEQDIYVLDMLITGTNFILFLVSVSMD
ncbi:hypothetical protein MJT46_011768 [Ovis ammon polii x Ovis aries]|nr:hypothetical protein MJT46_011768 [Ovis ammon polii x Ovis aries]